MQTNYESIAYNKDFLTGTKKETTKTKRDKGIKGKVTLSLFDAETGEKVKEAYTENLIPDLYFKDCFLGQFLNGIMGVGNLRYATAYNWFSYLYLTDSDKPENANEQRIEGNIIGYADRNSPYSGDDPQRGTINRAETKFSVSGNKIKLNFVFDFPTHAANGITESIYFCESEPTYKDYFYMGAPIYARESGDNDSYIYNTTNPRRYYGVYYGFNYSSLIQFTSPTKGFFLLDGKNTNFTQSPYLQFPENLKGHWILMPFDADVNDCMLWEQAVRLLNADGNPLVPISGDAVKQYDGLQYASPYKAADGTEMIIGYCLYSKYQNNINNYYLRIYKWSKVGVLQSYVDVNLTQTFQDEYNTPFTRSSINGDSIFTEGKITVVGYNERMDTVSNERKYTSRLVKLNIDGTVAQNLEIKPKIGNSTWFATKSMDSVNIDRRCYVNGVSVSKSKVYLSYYGTQGGTSFRQCITQAGNLIDPYRQDFSIYESNYTMQNILGTDRYVASYISASSNYVRFMIVNALTSRPIGTHTRLAQAVEKTEANT
ncbi:MAG: hypothetical protein RSF40_10750, partial [Oscillospiraceae bacterium]